MLRGRAVHGWPGHRFELTGASTVLGPVRLRVADLDRTLTFWRDLLGLECRDRSDAQVGLAPPGADRDLVVLEVAPKAPPRPPGATGLYHVALLLPDRASLARAFRSIDASGGRSFMIGAADHLVSEALYYADPEGNGLELYADRPRTEWRWRDGELTMGTEPLDLGALRAETPTGVGGAPPISTGTVVGHVHLRVEMLDRTVAFYRERLGMEVTVSGFPGASFLSWGGYHHHLGLNVWGAPTRVEIEPGARGLIGWELEAPVGIAESGAESYELADPDGVCVRVRARG